MRMGVTGVIPADLETLTPAPFAVVAKLGLVGLGWSTSDGVGDDPRQWMWLKTLADSYGLTVCEIGVYSTNFVADDDVTAYWLQRVRTACEAAAVLGGDHEAPPSVVVGCGSHNPAGAWFWDRRNFSSESRSRLISGLAQVAKIAESLGVTAALEAHVNTTAHTAREATAIVGEAGSDYLRVHVDAVNWMTLAACCDSTSFLEELFQEVGALAGSCHAKDVAVRDEIVTNMVEVPPGEGVLDYPTYLRLATKACEWMLIEATPLDGLGAAKEYIDRVMAATVSAGKS